MAVTHPSAVRSTIADYVMAKINAGTVNPAGALVISQVTPTPLDLVSISFQNPAFSPAVAGVAACAGLPIEAQVTQAGTNTAQAFSLKDRDGSIVCSGSVSISGGGGDIQLSSVNLTIGDYVRILSLTYAAPN